MKDVIEKMELKAAERKETIKNKRMSRKTFFCIGVSEVWKQNNAIGAILKTLRNKHGLKWLRLSLSYHKFPNLRELLQGDLTTKLMEHIGSKDFERRECNCTTASKVDGVCIYGGNCRESMVIYKATCKETGKFYVGCTQQKVKKRFDGHFTEVCGFVNKGILSDSFARHFGAVLKKKQIEGEKVTRKDVRKIVRIETLWKGNPISCMKSFGKMTCSLCMKERLYILRAMRKEPGKLINSSNEIYGACRHLTRFHRYTNNYLTSTDDRQNSLERVSVSIPRNLIVDNENSEVILCSQTSDSCVSPLTQVSESTGNSIDSYDETVIGSYGSANLTSKTVINILALEYKNIDFQNSENIYWEV